jgi:hypothetical protein
MPEIWLRYGTTDVVLDIKFENLASQLSSSFQVLPEEQIGAAIADAHLTNNMLFLALSGTKAVGKVIMMLEAKAREKGFSVTVDVPHKAAGALRANLAGSDTISINRIEYQSLQERMTKFESTVMISNVTYDPLFGFAGAPTALLRNLLADSMAEAFNARKNNNPAPGTRGGPLRVATSVSSGIPATSVEIVANSGGIAGIHAGSINEAFEKAVSQFQLISGVDTDPVKCAIISASSEVGVHSTLAGSLNSLWNSVHAVRDGGTAILVAENREGLGDKALQMFIEGRLKSEQLQQTPYIDGLEHLLFMEALRHKCELGLVSTLPHYYARSKLGFATYAGMKDILNKLIEKYGKNFKALVLSDADIVLLKPRIG